MHLVRWVKGGLDYKNVGMLQENGGGGGVSPQYFGRGRTQLLQHFDILLTEGAKGTQYLF